MYGFMQSMVNNEATYNTETPKVSFEDGQICRFMIVSDSFANNILKEKQEKLENFGVPFEENVRTLGLRLRTLIVGTYDADGNYTAIIDANTTSLPIGPLSSSLTWFPPEYLSGKGFNMNRRGLSMTIDEAQGIGYSTLKAGGFPYLVNVAPIFADDKYNKFSKEAYDAYVKQIDAIPQEYMKAFAIACIMRNHALGTPADASFQEVPQADATHIVFDQNSLFGRSFTGRLKVSQKDKKVYANIERIYFEDTGEKYKTAVIAGKDFSVPAGVDTDLHMNVLALLAKADEEYANRGKDNTPKEDNDAPPF